MIIHGSLAPERHEQKLQETRKERQAETKKVERLSAILVKKMVSANTKGLPDKVA